MVCALPKASRMGLDSRRCLCTPSIVAFCSVQTTDRAATDTGGRREEFEKTSKAVETRFDYRSINGTFVRRAQGAMEIEKKAPLEDCRLCRAEDVRQSIIVLHFACRRSGRTTRDR